MSYKELVEVLKSKYVENLYDLNVTAMNYKNLMFKYLSVTKETLFILDHLKQVDHLVLSHEDWLNYIRPDTEIDNLYIMCFNQDHYYRWGKVKINNSIGYQKCKKL